MRLHILSDLHLGFEGLDRPPSDADVVVLAGDIARPAEAAEWALGFDRPVIYVLGNHEFYGASIDRASAELKRLCAGSHVSVLDDDAVVIDNVRFLGTTLWTDFAIFGDGPAKLEAMDEARRLLRDFRRIERHGATREPFTPEDSIALHERHAGWLDQALDTPHDGPTVVVTHHAPSPDSIHPRFAGSRLNACFVSDARRLMGGHRTPLWIHGHTHDSFDYHVDGTRVVCNPRGYAKDGMNENRAFDPQLVVDVG